MRTTFGSGDLKDEGIDGEDLLLDLARRSWLWERVGKEGDIG